MGGMAFLLLRARTAYLHVAPARAQRRFELGSHYRSLQTRQSSSPGTLRQQVNNSAYRTARLTAALVYVCVCMNRDS